MAEIFGKTDYFTVLIITLGCYLCHCWFYH